MKRLKTSSSAHIAVFATIRSAMPDRIPTMVGLLSSQFRSSSNPAEPKLLPNLSANPVAHCVGTTPNAAPTVNHFTAPGICKADKQEA